MTTELFRLVKGEYEKYPFEEGVINCRIERNSLRYMKTKSNDFFKDNNHYYEVMPTGHKRKFCIDLDGLKTPNGGKEVLCITYDEIVAFANEFLVFMRIKYELQELIKYRIQVSINAGKIPDNFKSVHIIFNLACQTHIEMAQVFKEFVKNKSRFTENIDISLYGRNHILRTINQSKEGDKINKARTDVMTPIGLVKVMKCKNRVIGDSIELTRLAPSMEDLVMTVNSTTPFIVIPIRQDIREIEIKTCIYHPLYHIDESRKLDTVMDTYKDWNTLDSWKRIRNALCSVLFLNRITDTVEIKAHPLVMKFLSKSRVGEYVSDEAQSNNLVRIIKLTQEGRSINPFDGYFHILSNAELEFIYTMLKLTPDAVLDCVIKKYNNKLCIHINGDKILYNLNNKSLLIDFEITKKYSATDTKKKNPKYIFSCITQYNYTIEELKRTCEEKIVSSSKFPMTYINNYSEVVANAYQSTYIHGAVGSRKSSLRMDLDIKDILLSVPNSRILMVSDTITMTDKTFIDMQNLVSSIRLDTSIVVHYTDKENVMDLTTRILIVCYDSLMKFNKYRPTHLVLDEFKNITKRFTIINGAKRYVDGVCTDYTNEDRNDHIKHFFSLFRCSGSVKLYDADCDDYLLNYLEQNTYTPFHIYSLINYTQTNNNIIVMSEEHAISEISELINNDKRISISIAWKKSAYKLHSYLSKDPRLANKRIVVITADGAFDNTLGADQNQVQLKKDLIIDPTLWGRYDAILYTPTITTGISYNEIGTFYKHYAFIGCGSDGTQQAQMMFRVRDVETKTIAVISIGDRLKTLVSNVRGALCDESHSDSYNKYNKSNINGNNDVISLTHIDTVITSQLDYNRGYTNGYNIGSSKTSYFKYWNNIDGLIKQDSELKLLYLVLRSCYRWGARNITFEFYKTHIPRKYNIRFIVL
jgi:hypothetical protein